MCARQRAVSGDGVVEDDVRGPERRDQVGACDVGGRRVLCLGRDKVGDAGLRSGVGAAKSRGVSATSARHRAAVSNEKNDRTSAIVSLS